MTQLYQASHQWASRPDDQRFVTLEELRESVLTRKDQSWVTSPRPAELRATWDQEDPEQGFGLVVREMSGKESLLLPTHHAFSQLCSWATMPAGTMRKLPAMLSAMNIQWGLDHFAEEQAQMILAQSNGDDIMRAVTSLKYGRIWDIEVVNAVINVNQDGRWHVPAASYSESDPKRATTLYASDRDVFIFLVDDGKVIEAGGSKLNRGFIAWNSETGDKTFGLTTFTYDRVCDNRIIWGASNIRELRIKHTGGAPDRFYMEAQRQLKQFAEESERHIIECVETAAGMFVPKRDDETVVDWMVGRGFLKDEAKQAEQFAVAERGSAQTLWDMVSGATAFARSIKHTDARVALERKAGDLMEIAKDRVS